MYTYPSKKSLGAIIDKVRSRTQGSTNQPLKALLARLNPVLRGWTNYFRHAASKATFSYLGTYARYRVRRWLRRKHPRATWNWLRRRYLPGWRPTEGEVILFQSEKVTVSRYRYRGSRIATPWTSGSARTAA